MPHDPAIIDLPLLERTLRNALDRLLDERAGRDHWEGELSSSALSTATAAFALSDRADGVEVAKRGLDWLATHQNGDGGWGDTADSPSNISTTILCWSALARGESEAIQAAGKRAERWISRILECGGSDADRMPRAHGWPAHPHPGPLPKGEGEGRADELAAAVYRAYGRDRTFSVPILTMAALAGRLGSREQAWRHVMQLPFELAAVPQRWFRLLRLPVVSYALPALIAMGQTRHHFRPAPGPLGWLRNRLRERTLGVLERIQPAGGGFLEAAPLTSFVAMCLSAAGRGDGPVVRRAAEFLTRTVRPDGSWPIDTNLATWVTTLAVNALSSAGELGSIDRRRVADWLIGQQLRTAHPYTGAAAGGWAWTNLSGGVPDADDTAGALLALRRLAGDVPGVAEAAAGGVTWLLDIQNGDGGVPTFCRGWTRLPFDRSGADLTAHALAAWAEWRDELPGLQERMDGATRRGRAFLRARQRRDGAWLPLWFGNQHAAGQQNPLYGTARVAGGLAALGGAAGRGGEMIRAGIGWIRAAQNADGGWGGDAGAPSTIEETSLALAAIGRSAGAIGDRPGAADALARGATWLIDRTESGRAFPASPIGLYFAKLWYAERLYPVIFAIEGLAAARDVAGAAAGL